MEWKSHHLTQHYAQFRSSSIPILSDAEMQKIESTASTWYIFQQARGNQTCFFIIISRYVCVIRLRRLLNSRKARHARFYPSRRCFVGVLHSRCRPTSSRDNIQKKHRQKQIRLRQLKVSFFLFFGGATKTNPL